MIKRPIRFWFCFVVTLLCAAGMVWQMLDAENAFTSIPRWLFPLATMGYGTCTIFEITGFGCGQDQDGGSHD